MKTKNKKLVSNLLIINKKKFTSNSITIESSFYEFINHHHNIEREIYNDNNYITFSATFTPLTSINQSINQTIERLIQKRKKNI